MAGEVQTGAAVVFSTGAVGGIVSNFPQSITVSRRAEKRQIMDTGGVIRSNVFYKFEKVISLSIVATGSTKADAKTAVNTGLYKPGTTASITNANATIIDGDYNVDSSEARLGVGEETIIDLQMSKGDDGVDDTTAVN